jgi:hypothetical protein
MQQNRGVSPVNLPRQKLKKNAMAKGNTGNLLQHFVAIMVADKIIRQLSDSTAIEYIDLFAMRPWEEINQAEDQFKKRIKAITDQKQPSNHCVTSSYRKAFTSKYPDATPPIRRGFSYPNTATLLEHGFPKQKWLMQLHDIDQSKQTALQEMIDKNGKIQGTVLGKWQNSLEKRSQAREGPVLAMLDPNQINLKAGSDEAKLGVRQLISIASEHKLNLFTNTLNLPAALLAFSYTDHEPDKVNRHLRQEIDNAGWEDIVIERITTRAHTGTRGRDSVHQGWIIHKNIKTLELQAEWDSWLSTRI